MEKIQKLSSHEEWCTNYNNILYSGIRFDNTRGMYKVQRISESTVPTVMSHGPLAHWAICYLLRNT